MIDPYSLAFDIDGVLADTMTLFLDIAREEYKIRNVKYEDITCYILEECVNIDPVLIETILTRIMDGTHKAPLKPMPGARNVLNRLSRQKKPILFVTARPHVGPIYEWMHSVLHLEPDSIEVVATGSFDAKVDVLETCYPLFEAGVTPIIFKQPWNRKRHPFVEVDTWKELESLIKF